MTTANIKNDVLVKLQASTTTAFYTDTILNEWANKAHRWATSYKKWPFTEYMDKSGAFVSGTEEYAYPNTNFKTDSIRILKIGNDIFQKVAFKDYLTFRKDYQSNNEKIFSDYGRTLYINPNCTSGTIYSFGQLLQPDINEESSATAFTAEEEGNEAIVQEIISYAKEREKKLDESAYHHKKAMEILEILWQKIADEQHTYIPKESGMWKRVDILNGDYWDDQINNLQF